MTGLDRFEPAGLGGVATLPAEPARPRIVLTPRLVLWLGLPVVAILMVLTAINFDGRVQVWENAQWTAAGLLAFAYPTVVAWRSVGSTRIVATLIALGTGFWLIGQLLWDAQIAVGFYAFPAPSDLGYLLLVVPVAIALVAVIRGRLPQAEELSVYLDAVAIFLAITALILAVYGGQVAGVGMLGAAVAVTYPIIHLATAGAGIVALLTLRASPRGGGYVLLAGFAILGLAWIDWLRQAMVVQPPPGDLGHYGFSIGIILVGLGGSDWRIEEAESARLRQVAAIVLGTLPVVSLLVSALLLVGRHLLHTEFGLVDVGALIVVVLAGFRQTVLVHERGRLLDGSRSAHHDLEVALLRRAQADSRYQVLVERVPAAVYIDVADDAVSDGGRLAYMSPQIEAILGYPPSAFIEDPELWPSLIHPADRTLAMAAYTDHWTTERPLRIDYRMIAADETIVWVHDEAYTMREDSIDGVRVSQGLLVDTTEQKRLEAQLLHDTLHDPLTGLANRVLFREHADRALSRSRRRRSSVALLFLDLDDFKVINDSLGHRAGDRLLIEVARRLTSTLRSEDVAARQGGDEFTVLVERVTGVAEAEALAERLAVELSRPIELEGRQLVVRASIGIALAGAGEIGADDLLAHADAAMYAAKSGGKARHAIFDPSMRLQAQSRLELEAALRAAIENEEFDVHYQPIVALPSIQIVGFEALVRWRHPARGLIAPDEFIPLAEATGLIVPLGKLVTIEACRQLRAWRLSGPGREGLTISVNVSPRQAVEPGFAAQVKEILAATQLEPSALVLEITESLTLHESATSDGSLRQLRDLGVQLAIDDFGTGFSALEYFKRFTVQGLKIDRSFIDGLGRSREDTAIVTATLAFASALDLGVTAEGVETHDQLERLVALGCQQAQGYLFSRPVPSGEVIGLLDGSPVQAQRSDAPAA
ncbi:MAG TPA: EAL domain-containing protein [Candidatus Limnocylindrales bacterium]